LQYNLKDIFDCMKNNIVLKQLIPLLDKRVSKVEGIVKHMILHNLLQVLKPWNNQLLQTLRNICTFH